MKAKSITYLPSAPNDLVVAHREQQVGKGYKQLELLITHPDMKWAWQVLAKRAKPDDTSYGMRLFLEIVSILHNSRPAAVRLRRSEEKSALLHLAKKAEELASLVEHGPFTKRGGNGPFNKLVFEYFPADLMEINRLSNWGTQNGGTSTALACAALPIWPSLPELLRELASQATEKAQEAMIRPRLVNRSSDPASYRQIYFIRALTRYMEKEFGSPLYGTVAHITNAIFATGLRKKEVEKLARGSP